MHAAVMEVAVRPEFRARGERFNPLAKLTIKFPLLFRAPCVLFERTRGAVDRANQLSASYLANVQAELIPLEKPLTRKLNLAIERLLSYCEKMASSIRRGRDRTTALARNCWRGKCRTSD